MRSSGRSRGSLRLLVLLVLAIAVAVEAATGDVGVVMYNTLRSQDATIVAFSTSTMITGGATLWTNTHTRGVGNRALGTANDLDRCFHMNTMSEILVTVAALDLIAVTGFGALDDALSTLYTPSNVSFVNPTTGYNITYRHLMQHTSTISDGSFPSFVTTSGTIGTLADFVNAYFITSTSGVATLNTAVFSTKQPGLATSYAFARANTALLAFILESVIAQKGLGYSSLDDYITTVILAPLGMSATFFLHSSAFPGITTIPSFSGTYSAVDYTNTTNSAAYFAGCVIDQMGTTTSLHPSVYADYNGYTTLGDVMRLIRGLFYTTKFSTYVSLMKSSLALTSSVARMSGHRGQGLSFMYFNGDTLCSAATATGVVNACPVSNLTTIYGYVANREFVESGFFCADSATSNFGLVCVAGSMVHTSSSTRSPTNLYALAAATLQELYGTFSVSQAPVGTTTPAAVQSEWFGVYSFLGVYLTLLGVLLASVVIQWLFQPAALAQAMDSGGAASIDHAAASRGTPAGDRFEENE